MSKEKVVVPTTEEVMKLLEVAIDDKILHLQTIDELLGMKWVDSFLPPFKGVPEWGYEGLKVFLADHGIEGSESLNEALSKLK